MALLNNDRYHGNHIDRDGKDSYRPGDRYDVDEARVVSDDDTTSGRWLLPLLIVPLLALGIWAGSNYLQGTSHPGGTTTAQSDQNYKAAPGVGGGPGNLSLTPTASIQSSSNTRQSTENLPQAGIGGSGVDSSTSAAVPTTAPDTGRGGK